MVAIKKFSRWAMYAVLVLLLIFVLLAVVVRFVVFPNIDSYKDDIAAYASKTAGQKITIGDIQTGWDGISPKFVLKNVDVFDAEQVNIPCGWWLSASDVDTVVQALQTYEAIG